jgi:hypothetical protein
MIDKLQHDEVITVPRASILLFCVILNYMSTPLLKQIFSHSLLLH